MNFFLNLNDTPCSQVNCQVTVAATIQDGILKIIHVTNKTPWGFLRSSRIPLVNMLVVDNDI